MKYITREGDTWDYIAYHFYPTKNPQKIIPMLMADNSHLIAPFHENEAIYLTGLTLNAFNEDIAQLAAFIKHQRLDDIGMKDFL